ncbi:Aldehyde dehydrogenase [Thalassocella blandensis]|nr:Aldehyde dehydrogenase [Thalassocella blandensis]
MSIKSINPYNNELVANYNEHSVDDVHKAANLGHQAFLNWSKQSFSERATILVKIAHNLEAQKHELAKLITIEMGKPIKQAESEIDKCVWVCRYYAENTAVFLQHENIQADAYRSYVAFEPLGLILAVMPWNFPFWQVFRFAAPALMAGNTALLKHASNVSGCAIAIENLLTQSGLPEGCFKTLLVSGKNVEHIIAHPHVKAVTLTGSTGAGKSVAETAGRHLKKTVLELGGSDPYIILADADVKKAAKLCATSRLINSGQSCIGAKRFIVVDAIREAFEQAFVEELSAAKAGVPHDSETDIGPLARSDLRDDLHQQIQKSIQAGAVCLMGGELPQGSGNFYPVTVLTNVRSGMPAYGEELFGPAAAIIPVSDEEQAIAVANDTCFGLGAAVFTQDLNKGEALAHAIEAGCCVVNDFVKSDPRLPFGGVKQSGYGRELSHYGIKEFVNIKTVVLNKI